MLLQREGSHERGFSMVEEVAASWQAVISWILVLGVAVSGRGLC